MRTRAAALIGRGTELEQLTDALADVRRAQGSTVFITGEPGIGKTRLAAEAVGRALDAGMVVLRGRCSTTGPAVPFRPLTEALLSLAREGDPALRERLGPYGPVLGRLVLDWADEHTAGGDGSLVVLAEALLRLTSLVGEKHGCLLTIEDLHDADVETLAVLEYLAGNLTGQPVLVLATVRSDPSAALSLTEAMSRRREAAVIPLRRLDAAQVHQVVASCLSTEDEQVPEVVAGQLFNDSAGNPLVIEELLHSMVSAGELIPGRDGWRLQGGTRTGVPPTLVHTITERTERLGPQGVRLLSVAAVLGRSFPLSVVQAVLELDDHNLLSHLQAAVSAQLLALDERGTDWYAFQHPLTAEALLSRMTPADRTALSAQAADAVERMRPGLPGEWCHLAAALRLNAGQRWAAAGLYVEVGRRVLAGGAPGTAIVVLEDAEKLLGAERDDPAHRDEYRELLETLLFALAEAGQFDRALRVAEMLRVAGSRRDTGRQIELHVRLAWAAQVAGRWAEGAAQVDAARALLPEGAGGSDSVLIDAVDAYLTMAGPVPDRLRRSEELGRRAVRSAEAIPLPETACQAWYAIGFVVRERDLAESDECFGRVLDLAAEHRFTSWRNYALTGLGGNAWLAEADTTGLERARSEALRTGGISLAYSSAAVLALDAVLRGELDRADRVIEECFAEASRLHLVAVTRYLLMARATAAGQRGDREAMRAALAEFHAQGGGESTEQPLAWGLAQVFCALLEENRELAETELAGIAAKQSERPSTFYLAGTYGLKLLLDVLAGRADRTEHERISACTPASMRWNRHFVALAEAVLLGREGRAAEADGALARAAEAARPFRTARHLGLRLVAEAAAADGWGAPSDWLREAEEYFHGAGVGPVAGACRALLRRIGTPVRQRRSGTDRVPAELRRLGVTSREFEVFELLVVRLGNKGLAARLHISPRTVEKHVASLLMKTGQADRAALADHAAELLREASA